MQKQLLCITLWSTLLFSQTSVHAVKIINKTDKRILIEPSLYQASDIDSSDNDCCIAHIELAPHSVLDNDGRYVETLESLLICIVKDGPKRSTYAPFDTYVPKRCDFIGLRPYHVIEIRENPELDKNPVLFNVTIDTTQVPSWEEEDPQAARIVTREEAKKHYQEQQKKYGRFKGQSNE